MQALDLRGFFIYMKKQHKNCRFSKFEEIKICNYYLSKEKVKIICNYFKIDLGTLYNILKRNNIKLKGSRTYTLNENYFENIDTKDKAYFLGLLTGDGNIYKNNLRLILCEEDVKIINNLKNKLNYSGSLYYIDYSKKLNHKNQYRLEIYSPKIVSDLAKYNLLPNKAHNTKFPEISKEFYSHFIRGVFDADGCIHLDKSVNSLLFRITGNMQLINKIQEILIENCNLNKTKLHHKKADKENTVSVVYKGNKQTRKIYEWLYQDCEDYYIDRKNWLKLNDLPITVKAEKERTSLFN